MITSKSLATVSADGLKQFVMNSTIYNSFLILNALKLIIVHMLIDTYPVDAFIVITALEYLVFSYLYYFLPLLVGGRLLFLLFYVVQAAYISLVLNYSFVFMSNIHIKFIPKLIWEFTSVYGDGMTKETLFSVVISLMDIYLLITLLRSYRDVRKRIFEFPRLLLRQFCAGLLLFILIVSSVNAYEFIETGKNIDRYKEIEDYSLHHYGLYASGYLELYNYRNTKESIRKLNYSRDNNSRQISSRKQPVESPSVLLIQVESLDANIIGQKWRGKFVAPFLTKLAKENVYYPYTLSYRSAGGTSDTEIAIINNVEPLSDTPTVNLSQYDFPNSIAKVFTDNKYRVRSFHGNVGTFYNRNTAYALMGFDIFYDQLRMRLESQGWGAPDDKVFDFVVNNIGTTKRPFFNYVITMSSHEPFKNVYNYYNTNRFNDVTPVKLKDYFTSVSYVDKSLSRFITQVTGSNPNMYIYIFGDHAPYVLQNKSPFTLSIIHIDNKELQFVPMIIVTPDHKKFQESTYAATFLDIAPTILLNNNLDYSYQIVGNDLLKPLQNNEISYKGKLYQRDFLYQSAKKTRSPSYGNN